jgi:hypothetical protein
VAGKGRLLEERAAAGGKSGCLTKVFLNVIWTRLNFSRPYASSSEDSEAVALCGHDAGRIVSRGHYVMKTMHAGVPTPVYCPVKRNSPVLRST